MLKQNIIRVPEGCPTMNAAVELAVVFSERNECTRENPVKVEVGQGKHEMGMIWTALTYARCNSITIVGKGKGKTTILGGFCVDGAQNVKIEQLTVTNGGGNGLVCKGSRTNVDVTECCVKNCSGDGMSVSEGSRDPRRYQIYTT